jgi:hypothetical protein
LKSGSLLSYSVGCETTLIQEASVIKHSTTSEL